MAGPAAAQLRVGEIPNSSSAVAEPRRLQPVPGTTVDGAADRPAGTATMPRARSDSPMRSSSSSSDEAPAAVPTGDRVDRLAAAMQAFLRFRAQGGDEAAFLAANEPLRDLSQYDR